MSWAIMLEKSNPMTGKIIAIIHIYIYIYISGNAYENYYQTDSYIYNTYMASDINACIHSYIHIHSYIYTYTYIYNPSY